MWIKLSMRLKLFQKKMPPTNNHENGRQSKTQNNSTNMSCYVSIADLFQPVKRKLKKWRLYNGY